MMSVISLLIPCLLLSIIQITFADIYVYNSANKLVEDYDDQAASFGPPFTSEGIKGYVALTNPKNACTKVAPPPTLSMPGYQWIALIPRTNSVDVCDFDLKVLNAQEANYSAVIIYNYEDALIAMGPHGRNIKIPSTLITHSDGLSIVSNYLYNKTTVKSVPQFHIRITGEQLFNFRAYLIPFLCIIGVSFLGLISFTLVKCYLHRRRTRRHRLPRSALKQLKIKKFVKGDRWEVCAICLDDYEDGAKLRILPCDHAYHMKCIDPWLLNNRRQCPVCKRYVFPSHDNSDEESSVHATTERTPLIRPSEDNIIPDSSRNRQLGRRTTNYSDADSSNFIDDTNNDTSDTDDEANISALPRQSTSNRITTNDLVFDEPQLTAQHYSHSQLPRIILRESSSEGKDMNNTTTTTSYGSFHDSPLGSFITPRAANFFVGSLGGTTDNTNISARSVIEDVSDIETDNNDERMYSVLTDTEINHAYVSDEAATDMLRTNL
ncbi:unnamed protein product [Adineta steineri]|uniref:RING-type domain-containing protein n=1 Tax=Adineta steineri TaxID=433720 RepID=A0A813MCD3_9BILA|nr:unnamed protein product [Adineta steineri]